MFGEFGVGQVGFITQLVFKARPVIHRDGAELHFDRRVMRAGRQEHRDGVDYMEATVAVRFGVFDVILDAQHLDIRLSRQVVRYRVHVIAVVANHADTGDIEQVVFD